ncbi:MarR family transcriptional regulator [Glutamicibacter sp.]|uniref:MarR family winged helix-turn-helix transcriptional regulator n=1 Tax=Glutamicibacter sp. TaxID=1931995 RepID=UPI0028BD7833|nr:MarR family transcriptional regulator [Glutamicibacter sp.]
MPSYDTSDYWYTEESSTSDPTELLNLLRQYQEAERKMRTHTRGSMGMSENDMHALYFLLRAHSESQILRQRDFTRELGISDASVSGLIDRLCRDGYAQRIVHPADRRSAGIIPTEYSDSEVRATLESIHQRMQETAENLSPEERTGAARFLRLMINCINEERKTNEGQPRNK